MGRFINLYREKIFFSEKGKKEYKLILNVENINNHTYNITYKDKKSNKNILKIKECDVNKYIFIKKTSNLYHKPYEFIQKPIDLLKEMDTSTVGFGNFTTDHGETSGDNYATGDARNLAGGSYPLIRRNFPGMIMSPMKNKKRNRKKVKLQKNKKKKRKPQ